MKYLLVAVLLLTLGAALSPEPIPSCSVPKIQLKDLPVSVNQIQTFNVNDLFTGFNLDFELSSSAPDFVRLKEKTVRVKSHDIQQVGLKSYHLDHMGNRWGRNLMTLSENNWVTKIRWGSATANETIPDLSEEVTVQSEQNIYCYDAIWLRQQHIAIVDCAKKITFGLQNIFIYVNTTSQTVLPKTFENDMYVGFTTITRRRMVLHRENEFTYLIRAYFSNNVDIHHAGNTYLDIMTIVDPFKPRTLKVIDRSFLHQQQLAITDFKLYNGALYLLDYTSGVIVFDFTAAQQVRIDGRYRTDSGYLRMGIYSGHLDNEIILALANEHAIYQVDFSNHLTPNTIAKYNLMQQSRVHNVWVNEEYVIAQVSANVTTAKEGETQWYNSSIVFNRNSRTYLHAYDILEHSAENVIIDLERDRNLVLVIDPSYMNLYQLNTPIMSVYPTDQSLLGKEFSFYIKGNSVNTYTNHSLFCSFDFKFKVVDVEDMKIYPTGLELPQAYYANYPGELFIDLQRYALGPNITYGVHQSLPDGRSSAWWVLQQNTTRLHWEKQPSMAKITFLRQEQFDTVRDTIIYIYTQDAANITHFLECETPPFAEDVKCKDDGYLPHVNYKINNLTATRFDQYEGWHVHLAAIVYEDFPNEVFVYNADTKEQMVRPIILPTSFEGKITGIEFIGHYLAILLRYTKEIVFVDMRACIDHQEKQCEVMGKIDSIQMDRLGVNYFSPMDLFTSDFHPGVLFIQNLDRVIIVSYNVEGPHLLAQIESPGSKEPGFHKWKMAISRNHLVIVNPPNIIEEHSLDEIYTTRQAPMHKLYPLYKNTYTIPDSFDLDFSDKGDLIYITAEDLRMHENHNSVILVYRAGFPAAASFYDVFNIGLKFSDMLIDATGAFGDYVTVTFGSILQMFRQYEDPILVFDDNYNDFDFNVTFSNDIHERDKWYQTSSVKIANYPEKIVVNNSKLNQSDFLNSQIKYENDNREYILDDSDWWKGNVINYTLEGCSQCGDKLKVVNHLEHKRFVLAERDMEDYVFTHNGGIVQQFQSLLTMRHNGSIAQSVGFPAVKDGENCRTLTFNWGHDASVSACQHLGEIYLYLTTFTSFKPFVNGPHVSSASSVASIQMQEDILILVDVDENPSQMSREGGVLIYSLNHDISSPDIFNELEFIDTTDLTVAQGWTHGDRIFIGNAHLVHTNQSSTYRLAITELKNGVFFVDFKWVKGMRSVEILKIEFMDLAEELAKAHMPMPNMAFFQAVTVLNEFYDSTFKYWETDIIVTTRNFHIFEVKCHFDKTGTLLSHDISHVYYRYGFYETSNYIKTFDGYFAVVQKIPLIYQDIPWYSKQVVTVYDSRERWVPPTDTFSTPKETMEGDIPASYMLGGMVVPQGHVAFDFNFTLTRNRTDPFRDIGLLMLHARQATLREVLIHDHISIVTQDGIPSTQDAEFVAFNDFSTFKIPLNVVIYSGSDGWIITLIVLGCLIIAGVGGFFAYKWYLKRKNGGQEGGVKKSLLEEEGQEEDDDEDQDDEDDQSEQQEEVPEKPVAAKPEQTIATQPQTQPVESINRETLTSVEYGADEKKEELEVEVPIPEEPVAEEAKEEQK